MIGRKVLAPAAVCLALLGVFFLGCPHEPDPLREPACFGEVESADGPPLASGELPEEIAAIAQAAGEVVEDPEALVELVLLDLADGTPARGVTLAGSGATGDDGPPDPRTSDSSGRIRAGRSWFQSLRSLDADWVVPRQSRQLILETGEIWCHSWLKITGVVEGVVQRTGSSSPARIQASIRPLLEFGAGGKRVRSSAQKFHAERGVRSNAGNCRTGLDGRFSLTVPRIKGLLLHASTAGGEMVTKRIEVDSFHSEVDVLMTVSRVSTVSGRLIGRDGRPLGGTKLSLYCESEAAWGELDLFAVAMSGNGLTARGSNATGPARVCVRASARTDEEGRFSASVHFEGRGMIVAFVPGHAPIRQAIGEVKAGDRDLGDIHGVGTDSTGRISFAAGGRPLGACGLLAVDVSSPVGQHIVPCGGLDGNGTVSSEWFERGREYYLMLGGPGLPEGGVRGCLKWDGEEVVDVETALKEMK